MSLRPDNERAGRARSASSSVQYRDRSRSNAGMPRAPEPPSAVPGYALSSAANGVATPSYDTRLPPTAQRNSYIASSRGRDAGNRSRRRTDDEDYDSEDDEDEQPRRYAGTASNTRPEYRHSSSDTQVYYPPPPGPPPQKALDHSLAYGDESYLRQQSAPSGQPAVQYRYTPNSAGDAQSQAPTYQYAQPPQKLVYTSAPRDNPQKINYVAKPAGPPAPLRYTSTPNGQQPEAFSRTYAPQTTPSSRYESHAQVVEIAPSNGRDARSGAQGATHRYSLSADRNALQPLRSPGPGSSANRLSVSGQRPDLASIGGAGGLPPPSPLLEAYHGTYQSISPMPLALRLDDDDELDGLSQLSTTMSRNSLNGNDRLDRDSRRSGSYKKEKRVKLYNAEEDAKKISTALNHHTKIDADALCDILPHLSHDQVMELRKEYKNQVKVQGKGVNLSKHVKTKLTGNFGKAAYIVALGRWEGEGYWANFWYQSHGSRRELLIESLMGRTNSEIRMIKDDFKDKRYSDSLVRCMEKELKMDKFRTAVLTVLEERRQEEQDNYPIEYIHRDVDTLNRAVLAERGGESAMLEIIVKRSDAHLREVLKIYERMYGENFARVALNKSNNLVGEVIAHILNGVINKPARDALLLQHAIRDIADHNREDDLRYELLISRLVRIHWDRLHMTRVKKEYYEKYRITLEDAIDRATKGDFREFMCELCDTN